MLLLNLGFQYTYANIAIENKISELENHGIILAARLNQSGYMSNPTSDEINNEIDYLTDIYNGKHVNARIIVVNKNLSIIKDTYESETNKTIISENVIRCLRGNATQNVDRKGSAEGRRPQL